VEAAVSDDRAKREAQAEWLHRAAEVAETLTDDEILSLGRRLRSTTAEWLRHVATLYPFGTTELENLKPAEWVMRLLLEERGHTLKSVRLGPRNQE
jgi:hypothetical protein